MKQNVGKKGRAIRIIVFIILVAVAYHYSLWWLYIISLIPLFVAITGKCPIYPWFNINTNKK